MVSFAWTENLVKLLFSVIVKKTKQCTNSAVMSQRFTDVWGFFFYAYMNIQKYEILTLEAALKNICFAAENTVCMRTKGQNKLKNTLFKEFFDVWTLVTVHPYGSWSCLTLAVWDKTRHSEGSCIYY